MHELPVTENLLEIVLRHANNSHAREITAINIVIGEMATIIDESVQFYWSIISKGSIAENAKLNFRRVKAEMECRDCGTNYLPEKGDFSCPECGGVSLKLKKGDEFYVESIDIET